MRTNAETFKKKLEREESRDMFRSSERVPLLRKCTVCPKPPLLGKVRCRDHARKR